MKKIGVVITDGVGYRNFVLSDFIDNAKKQFDEVIIFSCLPKSAYDKIDIPCKVVELDVFEETFKTWFFRKAKELAHLQLHRKGNFGITDNLNANYSKVQNPRGTATRFLFGVTEKWHSEKWIGRYNRWQQKTFRSHGITKQYEDLLKQHHIDLLFFTHQRPPYIAPLIYAGQKLGIPTAAFIFSWDNLASKGRMAGEFDHYLVWSDLMKSELLQFYTSVRENQVSVVGTPQFEPYVLARYETDKEEFCRKFELDPSKKIICFSCGDISTSKNDELYIEKVAEAIKTDHLKDVNFLVRTSPAEDPVRFAGLGSRYPFIKWNYPKWELSRQGHQEAWSQRIPTVEDVSDLRAVLQFSDLSINMLSTMSLDFMCFDKPVINPVFGNQENGLYNDQRFLKYAHIEQVVNSKATRIVKNKEELLEAIDLYLETPQIDSGNRKALFGLQVSRPLENTGKRIAETLCNLGTLR